MTASGFRVRVTGLVFVFKSACLVLQQVPNCIRKPKTNTFDKSSFYFGYSWSFQMVSGHFIWFQVVFRSFYVVLDRFRLFQLVPHFSKYQVNILFQELHALTKENLENKRKLVENCKITVYTNLLGLRNFLWTHDLR